MGGQLSKTEGPIAIGVEHARSFREQNAHAADANKVAVQRGNSFGAHPSNKNHHNYDYNNNNNIHHQQQHQHVRHNGNHGRRDKVALEISAMANSGASSGTNRSSTESLTLPSITAHHSTEAKAKDADELVSTSSGSSTRSLKNGPALSPPASTPPSNPATPKTQQPYVGNTETKKRSLKPITNWQKGELIGQGAFGRVYLGMNADSGELIAIKEVSFVGKISNIQEQLASLQREIEVLKQLEHHNIVRYLGVERVQNSLNIFLEYVPGGSIASLLSKFGSLSESVVKKYTRQILQGLMYLHEHRIIHRDIKGANVLVDVNGTIKLTDFGASKQIAEIMTVSDGFKSLQGTPFWMAPEVIMQTGHGRSADIWSVGCTVLEMFTGKPPWSECTTQLNALFHIAHTNELPAMPSHLSANAKDFLCQCFERNPKRRPSASQLLNHPFLAEDAPSSTRHNVVLERLPPPSSAALHTQQSSSANSTDDTGGNGQPNFNSHNGEPPSPVNISLESIQVGSSTIFNSNRGSGTFVDTSLRSQKTDEWFTGLVSHQNNTKIDSNRMPHDDNKSSKPKSARRRDGKPKPEAIKTSQPAGSEHTENANAYNPVEEPVMSDDDGAPPALTNKIDIIESRLQKLPASGELERLIGDATVSNMPNTTANSSLISISNNNDNDPEGARLRDEELELSISRFLRSSRRDSLKLMTNEMLEAFRRLAKDADDDNFLYDDNDNAGMSKDAADDDDGNNNGNNNGASHDRGRQKHPRRRRERKGSGTERDRETSLEQQQQIVKSKSSRRRKKAEEGVIRDDTINDDPVSNGCTNFNSNSNNNNNVARGRATSMSPIEPQAFSQQRNNAQRIAATTTATIAPATTTLGAAVSAGPSHNFIASAAIAGSKARSLYPIRTDHNRIQSFDDNDDDDTVMHDDMSSPIVLEVPPPPLYQKWDRLQRSDYGGAYGLRVDSPSRNNTPSSPLYGVSAAAAAATTTTSQPINSGIDNGGATTSWRLSPSPGNRQRPTTATTTTTNPTNTTQSSSTFRAKKIDWS